MTEPQTREINQDDILDLIACAEDYGHRNPVCLGALVEWALPVTDADIKRYCDSLGPEYEDEQREELTERIRGIVRTYG